MGQINYYDRVGVSNSYLSHLENLLLKRNKNKQFRPHSWSNFVGDCVHKLMAGELKLSDIIVTDDFFAKLSGNQVLVWEKIQEGMTVEDAVRDTYKVGIDKQIEYFKTLVVDYLTSKGNMVDKINISVEKLKWGYLPDEKVDDNYTLYVIQQAYKALDNWVKSIQLAYHPIEEHREDELYWTDSTTGLLCKAKPDYWIVFLESLYLNKKVEIFEDIQVKKTWLFDFKIGSGEIFKKIKDRRYIRQLSFYAEAIKQKYGYIVDKFTILYFNIDTLELQDIDISLSDIECAKNGGYYTPDWFNQRLGMFCNTFQLERLYNCGFWDIQGESEEDKKKANPQYYIMGWRQLLDSLSLHSEGTQFIEPHNLFSTPTKNIQELESDLPF